MSLTVCQEIVPKQVCTWWPNLRTKRTGYSALQPVTGLITPVMQHRLPLTGKGGTSGDNPNHVLETLMGYFSVGRHGTSSPWAAGSPELSAHQQQPGQTGQPASSATFRERGGREEERHVFLGGVSFSPKWEDLKLELSKQLPGTNLSSKRAKLLRKKAGPGHGWIQTRNQTWTNTDGRYYAICTQLFW